MKIIEQINEMLKAFNHPPCEIDVEITRTNLCLHSSFEAGENTFGVYLSTGSHFDDDELNEAIQKWAEGGDVDMNFRFSVRECVEDMIFFHRHINADDVVMDEADKPMVDALRTELLEMVARLDEIRFAP